MKVIESPSCKDRSTPSIKIDRNLPVLYTQVHPAVPSQSHSPKQGFQVSPARPNIFHQQPFYNSI